jgi:carbon-monoxide dehydrogenase medium subunit
MYDFDIVEPETVEEALALLNRQDPAVRPIAGGTALMLMMKAQFFVPERLVSLRRISDDLSGISLTANGASIKIGASTTFTELADSALLAEHLPIVRRVMKTLANVRIRNVATVGGNLAHGDPHLDLPPVWMALDAEVDVLSQGRQRRVPVADLFAGYYETTLADGELIAALHVPVRPGWSSAYAKVTTRAAHDWPALGIAVSMKHAGDMIDDIRLVLGAALDAPTRLRAAEAALRGHPPDDELLRAAGDAAVSEVDIESDHRGSATYKEQLLRIYLARTVKEVLAT